MICERCSGTGKKVLARIGRNEHYEPCPDCYGFGIVHCCDGDREQPEPAVAINTKATNKTSRKRKTNVRTL